MPRKLDQRQQQIDFNWCQRDAIIRDCVLRGLQDKHGDKVSMTTAKCVLSIINSHAGGREAWLAFETIASKVGKKLRTVKRAVEALNAIGLILVQYKRSPSGVPCNHYRIIWTELAILVPQRTVPVLREDSASFAEESASSGTQSLPEALNEAPPPTPRPKGPAGWRKVEEEFGKIGAIRLLASQYRSQGKSPDDLRAAITDAYAVVDLPANAGKITSRDGAVFTYLKTGAWPTRDEMASVASQEAHAAYLADMERLRIEADRARKHKSDAYDAKMELLESEYGTELDAMTQEEMAAMIDNSMAATLILDGKAGMFRDQLLERLAARRQFAVVG